MSVAYDKALEIIEEDVHANCDYNAYLTLRDAVDAMNVVERELRALVRDMHTCVARYDRYIDSCGEIESPCAGCPLPDDGRCDFEGRMKELVAEVGV